MVNYVVQATAYDEFTVVYRAPSSSSGGTITFRSLFTLWDFFTASVGFFQEQLFSRFSLEGSGLGRGRIFRRNLGY